MESYVRRLGIAAVSLLLVVPSLLLIGLTPGNASAAPLSYFAFGDSYSSGEGVPAFDKSTDKSSPLSQLNKCHRSTSGAYPVIFAKNSGVNLGTTTSPGTKSLSHFVACSGAGMAQITNPRNNGPFGQPGSTPFYYGEPAAQWNVSGLSTAQLITITIGGNDANFAQVLKSCVESNVACNTDPQFANEAATIDNLLGPLYNTYLRIKSKARIARLIVLTYPQIFSQNLNTCLGTSGIIYPGISSAEMQWIRDMTHRLDGIITTAATSAGADVLNLENAFQGHELCSNYSGSPSWVNGADWYSGLHPEYTFHPNLAGQNVMAQRLALCVASAPACASG